LAALLAQPIFAQSRRNEGQATSGIYVKHDSKFRGDPRFPFFAAHPTLNQDPTEQGLCSTHPVPAPIIAAKTDS